MAPMAGKAGKQRHKRMMRSGMGGKSKGMMKSGDQMTQQLNREELARVQGGAMAPPPASTEGRLPAGGPRAGGGAAPPSR
jgi:hypothetical protein